MSIKKQLRQLLPLRLTHSLEAGFDRYRLQREPSLACTSNRLQRLDRAMLNQAFSDSELHREWEGIRDTVTPFAPPDGSGGVNPGDRRAIYYLARALKARSVLEIGTHIGSSTLHLALALKHTRGETGNNVQLITVDIRDVNDSDERPWESFGASCSPQELIEAGSCEEFTSFVTSDSVHYLRSCQDRFDLIFLDGDHSAHTVYREIPSALELLREGGTILLHDYFPALRPLWSDGRVTPGPYLAVERLQMEGADLKALPLGHLPWPTKLNTDLTSLAVLTGS